MTKLRLEAVECFERDVGLRLPSRFGVIPGTRATQAVIRATVILEDGRTSRGVAAETLGAKWFDKSAAFSDAQNLDQLRQALSLAIELYRDCPWSTPFELYARTYTEQLARGGELGLVPLVAAYGPALLDRAILDALGRAEGLAFADLISRNVAGLSNPELTPEFPPLPPLPLPPAPPPPPPHPPRLAQDASCRGARSNLSRRSEAW